MVDGSCCGLYIGNGGFGQLASDFASSFTWLAAHGRARAKHGEPFPCRRGTAGRREETAASWPTPGNSMGEAQAHHTPPANTTWSINWLRRGSGGKSPAATVRSTRRCHPYCSKVATETAMFRANYLPNRVTKLETKSTTTVSYVWATTLPKRV